MATTTRTKDYALGKERRGTSPSNSQTTHSQKSGSRQSSSSTDKEKSTTPAENKHIPNYLRPTIASSPDALRLGKKNSNEDNQRLLRRRSFDKTPSASPRGQKALISPSRRDHRASPVKPAPAVPRERKLTVQSSSFSGKTTVSSTKPVLDIRASKTPNAVKQPFFSKNPKISITSPSRKESYNNNASSSTKAPSSHVSGRTLEHEAKQEEKEAVVHEVEEILKAESENESVHSHVPKSENDEDIDSVVTEVLHSGEDEKINPGDISTCTSEDLTVPPSPKLITGETDHHHHHHEEISVHEVKTDTRQEEKENVISKNESCIDTPPEEVVIEEVKGKTLNEAKGIGEDQDNETDQKTISSEEIGDVQNKVEEGSEGLKAKEAMQELEGGGDDDQEEAKQELEAANAVSRRQGGQGKKESPTAYNDVIEETASKLLEKRKNKVKALVGAFETVIDYESGASRGSTKD